MAGEISNGTIVEVQAGDLIPLYRPGQDPDTYNVLESVDEEWTSWVPNWDTNEFSGTPTVNGQYNKIGRQVTIKIFLSGNSGSANTFRILNLPFASRVFVREIAWVVNNSVSAVGRVEIAAAGTIMVLYPSMTAANNAWATTAAKGLFITLTYESTT